MLKPCKHPHCPNLTDSGAYCEQHRPKDARHSTSEFDYMYRSARWLRERAAYLTTHDRCAVCGEPANTVDHIIPHGGNLALFWDRSNWQPLCASCHSKKTMQENRGKGVM